jgi:hypothetical protein
LDESKADKLTLEPILGCFHGLDESKRVANTHDLVLSRTIQPWMEIKSIQDYDEQESIKEA